MLAELKWLPKDLTWDQSFDALRRDSPENITWPALTALANHNIDFVQTGKLDRFAKRLRTGGLQSTSSNAQMRVALLGSSTLKHLGPGIRVAGLRRGLSVDIYEADYGQYFQELANPASGLHAFEPHFICLSLDAAHLFQSFSGNAELAIDALRKYWAMAKQVSRCTVIQQKVLPVFPDLLGNNEYLMPDSAQTFVHSLNHLLEQHASAAGVSLLAVDKYAALDGLRTWHDAALWHRSKQEIHPAVSPLYGEYFMRIVGAQRGRSYKCLVLDLDNTLWGGVIGDDGLNGIVLGQGNATGEAYLAFQHYVLQLKKRGIILVVCSKNDHANAVLPFEKHPEMLLKRSDIACFVANWDDKASNLRSIAKTLNIGLDALVFADDNPFERNLVRQELPQVGVPEMPEDPALYIDCIASAGYFEALVLTEDDRQRAAQYQANAERELLRSGASDMDSYLRDMRMELSWQPFDDIGLTRVVQLINKTNQFNLTTQRLSEADVRSAMQDPKTLTWQVRLKDKFGDNGVIAILIGRVNAEAAFEVTTWLMSCRVLGRQVEEACLNLLVEGARSLGGRTVTGEYVPTEKNGMVRELYPRLGFAPLSSDETGRTRWSLDVSEYQPKETVIEVLEIVYAANY